jgi:hypothetical protein
MNPIQFFVLQPRENLPALRLVASNGQKSREVSETRNATRLTPPTALWTRLRAGREKPLGIVHNELLPHRVQVVDRPLVPLKASEVFRAG